MGKQLTHDDFILRLKEGNKSFIEGGFEVIGEYTNALSKIRVKTKYGECDIEANSLMKGYAPTITSAVDKAEYYISTLKEVHGELYDYSVTQYTDCRVKVKIICRRHGEITMSPKELLKGSKCRKCAFELNSFKLEDWKKINPENNGVLYLLRCFNKTEEFYKIGITSLTIEGRYKTPSKMPYEYEVLYQLSYPNRNVIWELEKTVKEYIRPCSPLIKFKGSLTECFEGKYLKEVERILKTYENYQIENWKNYESED